MATIQSEKRVSLRYVMRTHLPDGTVTDRPEERISFVYGVERQVPTLEKALEGRREGETLSLSIPPAEVYGEHDPVLIVEIPKKGLITQRLKEGQFYRQMKMGTLVSFRVLEIRPDTVLVDFNKPLVGIRVSMDLEILYVRDADQEEIRAARENERKKSIGCG
ncbi:MAG: FKBP-type peptidyl-prolyl cis-trans isomerase [Deltaproteobacteria bacterium]|nr:FKBP-type peptidyl-prolyl cis-trans isomerase [Deltaproteobacteria bacterium]